MDKDQLRQIALAAGLSSKIIIPLGDDALDPQSKAPSFYCVHAISGAAATDYIDLAMEIGQGVRFFAIQAPTTLMKNADNSDLLNFLASQYADAIAAFQPDGQIHIGGWSAGAIVALETARQLKAKGREVSALVVIDGAPKYARNSGSRLGYFAKVLWNLPGALRHEGFGQFGKELLSKFVGLRVKNKPQQKPEQEPGQVNRADGHPLQRFIGNFSLYPEYWQAFMFALYDAIETAAFLPYDGAVVVYESRTKPILLSGVREFWKSIAPRCQVVGVRAMHFNVVNWPQVVPLAADLKRRLVGKAATPEPN